MKKLIRWTLIILLTLVVAVFLGRNFIARKSVEVGVKTVTGFPIEIGSVKVGAMLSQVDVRDLKLMNPAGFDEPTFVVMPQLYIDYRLSSMLSGTPHINDILVDIAQLTIVKNARGESNALKLKETISSGEGLTKYQIDQLRVHIGTVTIKDYSKGKPSERTIPLDVDATYKDITDSTDITRLVLLTVMSQVKLPDIGINTDELKKGLGNVTTAAGETVKGPAETLEKTGKGVFDSLKKAVPQK